MTNGNRLAVIAAGLPTLSGKARVSAVCVKHFPECRSQSLEKSPSSEKRIAVFDYDHTLITGDSFWPFLVFASGPLRAYAALAEGLLCFAFHYINNKNNPD